MEISSPNKIVGKKFQISLYSVPEYVCALEEYYLFSGTSLLGAGRAGKGFSLAKADTALLSPILSMKKFHLRVRWVS